MDSLVVYSCFVIQRRPRAAEIAVFRSRGLSDVLGDVLPLGVGETHIHSGRSDRWGKEADKSTHTGIGRVKEIMLKCPKRWIVITRK